jgi:hypothetical protein
MLKNARGGYISGNTRKGVSYSEGRIEEEGKSFLHEAGNHLPNYTFERNVIFIT